MKYTPPWISLKLAEEEITTNYGGSPGIMTSDFPLCNEQKNESRLFWGFFASKWLSTPFNVKSLSLYDLHTCRVFNGIKVDSVPSFQLFGSSGKAPASKGQIDFPFFQLTKIFFQLILYIKLNLKKNLKHTWTVETELNYFILGQYAWKLSFGDIDPGMNYWGINILFSDILIFKFQMKCSDLR